MAGRPRRAPTSARPKGVRGGTIAMQGSVSLGPTSPIATGSEARRLELWLACAVCALAPMNFARLPDVYVTASDIAAFAFCVLLVSRPLERPRLGPAAALWCGGVVLLVLALLLSSAVHGDPLRGLVVGGQYVHALLVLPLVFVTRTRAELVTMAKAFLLSIAAMCLFGAWLIHVDGETNTRFVSGNGRMRSFVERTNEAAALIAMSVPLLLLMGQRRAWAPATVAILFALLGYGVLLTGSNSGLGGFVLALVLSVVLTRSWRLLAAGAVGAAALVAGFARWGEEILPAVFVERVLGALVEGDLASAGTYQDRLQLIEQSLARADDTLLLGVGADRFPVGTATEQSVHNAYLLLWVEGGPLAAAGLVAVVLAGCLAGTRALLSPRAAKEGACALATVLLFAALVNTAPHVYGRFWIVPTLIALALAWRTGSGSAAPSPGAGGWAGAAPRRLGEGSRPLFRRRTGPASRRGRPAPAPAPQGR